MSDAARAMFRAAKAAAGAAQLVREGKEMRAKGRPCRFSAAQGEAEAPPYLFSHAAVWPGAQCTRWA